MSESKFTKGPWKIYGDWGIQPESAKSDENIFATFESVTLDNGNNNGFDNAHLICAAPSMYKFIEIFIVMVEHGNTDCVTVNETMADEARLLLAKARGT